MRRTSSARFLALGVVVTCGILISSTMSSWAAYKPITLNVPSQLPQAITGNSYNYSFASTVSGGTGKPYIWRISGALPSNLNFNSSSGKLLGTVLSNASVGSYPIQICATGGKKGATSKIRNSICKSTNLTVVQGSSTTPLANNATGTYAGNINFPNLNPTGTTGCEAKVIARTVTLAEDASGVITGSTNNEKIPTLTGTRSGNTITVTLQSVWGARGPYTWQWTGDSISGTLPAFCWDLSTNALLNEGSYPFTLSTSSSSGTYSGNINFPNLNPSGTTGCEATVLSRSITLVESSGGVITGTTNHTQVKSFSGTRSGSSITVTLQTTWGARGPYVWTWSGSTLTGTFPAFCWNTSSIALLNEGSYQFTFQKI